MKELRKVIIKTLIAVWALAGGSLSLLLNGYAADIPIAKYFFTVLESLNGFGVETCFYAIGIGCVFYLVRNKQKNVWVSVLSALFAIFTIVGISYAKNGSLDCIFLFGMQFVFACFVALGYYFLYKNFILFFAYIYETKKDWFREECVGKFETYFFEQHVFKGCFLLILLLGLPWLIAFFPGTLQWDAHAQLWMALGVTEQTSYHPVFISNYMAACIKMGRFLFHSDSIGLFLFTFPQFICQSLVFAYVFCLMKKMKTPVCVRWVALFFWTIFPYFQIWGYTMVKDTYYYISFLLLLSVLTEIFSDVSIGKKHYVLFALAISGLVLARNDGRYIVFGTLLFAFFAKKKYWRIFVVGVVTCVMLLVVEEGIYMPAMGIGKGPTGEMLSVPLQQTARYLREHMEDVTEGEKAILEEGFSTDLEQIAKAYNPEFADPVKIHFTKNPDGNYLKAYFKVWAAQLMRHPDTYVQAYLNHVYGYFYPGVPNYGDYLIFSSIGNSDHWQDGYLDIQFGMKNTVVRDFLRHLVYTTEQMPVLSLFYGCGIYTYLLMLEAGLFLTKGKRRELVVLIPLTCVLLICIVSPVNCFLRYMMPVMVAFPLNVAWMFNVMSKQELEKNV